MTEALAALGVETRLCTAVRAVDAAGVVLGDDTRIDARTVVWTTGLRAAARLQRALDGWPRS